MNLDGTVVREALRETDQVPVTMERWQWRVTLGLIGDRLDNLARQHNRVHPLNAAIIDEDIALLESIAADMGEQTGYVSKAQVTVERQQ